MTTPRDTDFFYGVERRWLGIEFRYATTSARIMDVSAGPDGVGFSIPGVPAKWATLSQPQVKALYEFLGEELRLAGEL